MKTCADALPIPWLDLCDGHRWPFFTPVLIAGCFSSIEHVKTSCGVAAVCMVETVRMGVAVKAVTDPPSFEGEHIFVLPSCRGAGEAAQAEVSWRFSLAAYG